MQAETENGHVFSVDDDKIEKPIPVGEPAIFWAVNATNKNEHNYAHRHVVKHCS